MRKMESYPIISKHICKQFSKALVQQDLFFAKILVISSCLHHFFLHIGRWPMLPVCYRLSKPTWPFYLQNISTLHLLPSLPLGLVFPPPIPVASMPSSPDPSQQWDAVLLLSNLVFGKPSSLISPSTTCSPPVCSGQSSQSDLVNPWLDPASPLLWTLHGFQLQVC